MTVYTKLAQEVIEELGCHLPLVEQAIANHDDAEFMAVCRIASVRYFELVVWALDGEGRKTLDATIKSELKRIRRWD